jgi:hypothetical protein
VFVAVVVTSFGASVVAFADVVNVVFVAVGAAVGGYVAAAFAVVVVAATVVVDVVIVVSAGVSVAVAAVAVVFVGASVARRGFVGEVAVHAAWFGTVGGCVRCTCTFVEGNG